MLRCARSLLNVRMRTQVLGLRDFRPRAAHGQLAHRACMAHSAIFAGKKLHDIVQCTTLVGVNLVWFPDPSVMRMRGRGKKGLGNNYTPARALEFDLHVPLSGCG